MTFLLNNTTEYIVQTTIYVVMTSEKKFVDIEVTDWWLEIDE